MAMSTVARAQEQAQPDELRHSPSSDPPSRDASTTATLHRPPLFHCPG